MAAGGLVIALAASSSGYAWWNQDRIVERPDQAGSIMKVQTRCSWVGLSFDDGPDPSLTSEVLATLRNYGATATFYVVGERVRAHPALVHQAASEGHSIGNHTWSHENLEDRPISAVLSELDATDTEIRKAGVEPVLEVRPPRGALAPEIGDAVRAQLRAMSAANEDLDRVQAMPYGHPGAASCTGRLVQTNSSAMDRARSPRQPSQRERPGQARSSCCTTADPLGAGRFRCWHTYWMGSANAVSRWCR